MYGCQPRLLIGSNDERSMTLFACYSDVCRYARPYNCLSGTGNTNRPIPEAMGGTVEGIRELGQMSMSCYADK